MDIVKLAGIFQATLDQNQHEQAEKQLEQIHKIIGFLPTIQQIIMETSIELPIRQAAAIYFKNEICSYWLDKEPKNGMLQLPYSIHEQDRALIRNSIVDSVVASPDAIRISLSVALNYIIKHDFPDKWTNIIDKIVVYLQTNEPNNWTGALMAMQQLIKNYEFKNNTEKAPLLDAMKLLGPIIYKMMVNLLPDNSETSVSLQKMILKIIFILTQYSLPLSLFTNEFFTQWMEIIRQVLDREVPPEVNNVDIEERYELCWYKCKKWAIHTLVRIFERYCSKTAQKEYKSFGAWYIKTFSVGIIQVILKMLDQYSQNVYLPPRVLQQCINYLNTSVEHLETWKLLKPHISLLIEKVIFPLMCYTDEDDQLWNADPQEYIRRKFDFYEDYISPVSAAQNFLNTCCKRRKDMLKNTVAFSVQVLSSETSDPRLKDGALHMLGVVSDLLLKKKVYQQMINDMLGHYVFPFFQYKHPFLRARAAWVLHYFENFDFEKDETLNQAIQCLQGALLHDKELPVKVQAAISLHIFIASQDKVKHAIEANLNAIIIEYLNIIKDSQNDDVTNALQKILYVYGPKVIPISVQITEHLVGTLSEILATSDDGEDKTITTMGIMSAIDTVLMMIETKEVLEQVEPVALKSVFLVFNQTIVDLYEEAFNIVASLTDKFISNDMWKIYELLYQIMTKDTGVDFFTDMMSALHNFIVVDPDAFISNPNRIAALFEMCKFVLNSDVIEDIHGNVVKIIECFFLQFREKVENYFPSFIEIVLARFTKDVKSEELHTMCLQVMIVVFYFNHELLFQILTKLQPVYPDKQLIDYFFDQWLRNISMFLGLHDRKVCILGLSKLLSLDPSARPMIVNEFAPKILPETLKLFNNLKEAYKAKANADADSDDEDTDVESDDDDDDDHDLIDDDDDNEKEMDDYDFDDDDDDVDDCDIDDNDLTTLETFETTLDKDDSPDDEYVIFRKTVELLKHQPDQSWHNMLFANLDQKQLSTLEEIFVLAQRRQDAAESRKIEQGGGYIFANQTIPTNFNFGGGFSSNQ
ncbi:hypothetical protein RDWZM_007153 [Blomia tropicalis]|uniref:Importin N-terminal domain-containing protein n=1 Tax=Blomia tropicalis TaxID=40697 RepID=A0A9Q0M8K4_BLOTA|nr:hypothetical protein RDWZM_007153 [Blomia tropicalis]